MYDVARVVEHHAVGRCLARGAEGDDVAAAVRVAAVSRSRRADGRHVRHGLHGRRRVEVRRDALQARGAEVEDVDLAAGEVQAQERRARRSPSSRVTWPLRSMRTSLLALGPKSNVPTKRSPVGGVRGDALGEAHPVGQRGEVLGVDERDARGGRRRNGPRRLASAAAPATQAGDPELVHGNPPQWRGAGKVARGEAMLCRRRGEVNPARGRATATTAATT